MSARIGCVLVRGLTHLSRQPILRMVSSRSLASACPYSKLKMGVSEGLAKMNKLFLDTYAMRKEEMKKSLGTALPVILVNGDNLILRYQGKRTEVSYIPEHYHHIKAIAHVSCALDNLEWMQSRGVDTEEMRQDILNTLSQIRSSIEGELNEYLPLLEKYEEILQGKGSTQQLKGDLLQLIDDAAKHRIDALDRQVQKIKKELPEEARKKIAVVVMGPPLPREGELSMQYFNKVLGDGTSMEKCPHLNGTLTNTSHVFHEHRLIYAESIYDENEALNTLTSYICDEKLGGALLGDPTVMRADFLKAAAQKHLNVSNIERF